jgi:hypothetical protein
MTIGDPPASKQGCSLGAAQALGAVAIITAAAAATHSDVVWLILMCTMTFPSQASRSVLGVGRPSS